MKDESKKKSFTVVCSRDTLDGAYPSAVLAINAARKGMDATIYYTFSGLNVIRVGFAKKLKFNPPGAIGALPGASALATSVMKKKIEKADLPDLADLLEMCQLEGVKLVGCHMAATMFELDTDAFIEGVEIANADEFLDLALESNLVMFT